MRELAVIISLIQASLAFISQKTFKNGGNEFFNSSGILQLTKIGQNLDLDQCKFACLQSKACSGFMTNDTCYLTGQSPVRTSKSSNKTFRNFWFQQPNTPVPHFLLIYTWLDNGRVIDVSSDESLSPSVNYEMTWPDGHRPGAYMLFDNLTLITFEMRISASFLLSRKYHVWNFGSSSVDSVDHEDQTVDVSEGSSSAATGNVIFVLGATGSSWGYVNWTWRKLQTIENPSFYYHTCLSFIPGDTNRVYMIGSASQQLLNSNLIEYSFDTDSYSVVKAREGRVEKHGCIGFRDLENGLRYFAIVSDGENLSDKVTLFNFSSNAWTDLPKYPVPIRLPRVVEVQGFLYVFGGNVDTGPYKKAFKLNWKISNDEWTLVANLFHATNLESTFAIPYQ